MLDRLIIEGLWLVIALFLLVLFFFVDKLMGKVYAWLSRSRRRN